MIIDESTIANGITSDILQKVILKHSDRITKYTKLNDYYIGAQNILRRQKSSSGTANNKIVCNHAKYIVDMTQSYLTGNPITYASDDDFDIEPIKNAYDEQNISALDSEMCRDMSIFGRAYELIYADANAQPRSARLDPKTAFVCYSNTVTHEALFGVHYYRRYDLDGAPLDVICNVYTANTVMTFTGIEFTAMNLIGELPHYFGGVPLIEYENNLEEQGDYEQLIPLIDAYNILMSDRVNDKEQFVDAFLFLKNIELDTDLANKLRDERILMSSVDGAEAKYLEKVLNEADMQVLRNNLKEDIHRFSMVPDLSDQNFGSNLSGVAIKYKLMGFEQHVGNKERYFEKALRKRFERYNAFLSIKGVMGIVPSHRIDIIFTRNLPANNLETSQMIRNLDGIVSMETLLGQLDFVTDPKEEAEAVVEENDEKTAKDAEYRSSLIYGTNVKTTETIEPNEGE